MLLLFSDISIYCHSSIVIPLRTTPPHPLHHPPPAPRSSCSVGSWGCTTCCHCLTLLGINVIVTEASVWSCFILNIHAIMPAALTHFTNSWVCPLSAISLSCGSKSSQQQKYQKSYMYFDIFFFFCLSKGRRAHKCQKHFDKHQEHFLGLRW